jgi:hypothetical protein
VDTSKRDGRPEGRRYVCMSCGKRWWVRLLVVADGEQEDSDSRRGAFEDKAFDAVLFAAEGCGPVPRGVRRIPTNKEKHLTAFVARLNAGIVAQMLPLGLLCAAARISILQFLSTSVVFWEDRPSKESSSSGIRPMMCPSS